MNRCHIYSRRNLQEGRALHLKIGFCRMWNSCLATLKITRLCKYVAHQKANGDFAFVFRLSSTSGSRFLVPSSKCRLIILSAFFCYFEYLRKYRLSRVFSDVVLRISGRFYAMCSVRCKVRGCRCSCNVSLIDSNGLLCSRRVKNYIQNNFQCLNELETQKFLLLPVGFEPVTVVSQTKHPPRCAKI